MSELPSANQYDCRRQGSQHRHVGFTALGANSLVEIDPATLNKACKIKRNRFDVWACIEQSPDTD
jgi:hypothetical protein